MKIEKYSGLDRTFEGFHVLFILSLITVIVLAAGAIAWTIAAF